MAREQAYAATVHTYQTIFKEDPPSSYWGPPICSYKPLGPNDPLPVQPLPARDTAPRPPPLRRSPNKRDMSLRGNAVSNKSKLKASEALSRRNSTPVVNVSLTNATDKFRSNIDEGRASRRASVKSAKETAQNSGPQFSEDIIMNEEDASRSAKKTRRKFPGSSSLYILKPLRPGERRKRGRPSFSDYVLASSVAEGVPLPEAKKKDTKTGATEKPTPSKSASTSVPSLRRRRPIPSPTKPLPVSSGITKKEKTYTKPARRVARPPAAALNSQPPAPLPDKADPKEDPKSTDKGSTPAQLAAKEDDDGAVHIKRPRGRPRKDGSWPVPRGSKTNMGSKSVASVASKPASAAAAKAEQARKDNEDKKVKSKEGEATPASSAPGVQLPTSTAFPAPSSSTPVPVTTTGTNGNSDVGNTSQNKDVKDVMEDVGQGGNGGTTEAIPANTIHATDVRVQAVPDKEVSKSQLALENTSKDGILDQVVEGEVVSRKDSTGEVATSLVGKDMRIAQDVVFPQSEPLRGPVDMDTPLGAPPRAEGMPSVPEGTVSVVTQPQPTPEKLITTVNTSFPMSNVEVNPVTNPMEGGVLPVMVPKVNVGGEKGDSDVQMDGDDSKKPFKRPRGRPRKDSQWANTVRQKPMNEEAVERVKDLNDPGQTLPFPMEPSGAV